MESSLVHVQRDMSLPVLKWFQPIYQLYSDFYSFVSSNDGDHGSDGKALSVQVLTISSICAVLYMTSNSLHSIS